MVIYRNIEKVVCRLIKEVGMWECDISRALSEPKTINDQVCYTIKTETIKDVDTVQLNDNPKQCEVLDSYKGKMVRCQ